MNMYRVIVKIKTDTVDKFIDADIKAIDIMGAMKQTGSMTIDMFEFDEWEKVQSVSIALLGPEENFR